MTSLRAVKRHQGILHCLETDGSVHVGAMAVTLRVSPETVRRDLKKLAEQGHLVVEHGGARRPDRPGNGHDPLPEPRDHWERFGWLWAEMARGERF